MANLDKLEPANKADVLVYQPYYPSKDKQKLLPLALSLYNQGRLEGKRRIESGEGISLAASWYVSKLPSELTRCRVQFEGQAELSYEITILNSEFIDYLIDLKRWTFPRLFIVSYCVLMKQLTLQRKFL